MGIDQEKVDEKATGRFLVQAKIITYSTIEDAEFVVVNPSLAKTFKKNLKPYTGLNVWGNISSSVPTEEVVVDNGWGEENAMTKVNASAKREFVITGADSKSVDTTTFPQAKIEEAIVKIAQSKKAETDFADVTPEDNVDEGWGSSLGSSSDDDDEDW